MTSLLVVSTDTKWSYYIERGLGGAGNAVAVTESFENALHELHNHPAGHFNAILVDGGAPIGRTQEEIEHEIDSFLATLRAKDKSESSKANYQVPVLLWSSYQKESLSRLAGRFESTLLLANDTYATIGAALSAVTAKAGNSAEYACIELEIGLASLRIGVSVEGKGVIAQIIRDSAWRPKLKDLEDKFKTWALWQRNEGQSPRYTDNWGMIFKETGQQLADEINYEKLAESISECLKHVGELRRIHFRFSLIPSAVDATFPYVNVPFELLYDTNKSAFIRSLAPVARRIGLREVHRTATPLPGARTFTGRLLFIKSNAHGLLEIPGSVFGGKSKLVLPKLISLDKELTEIGQARGCSVTDPVKLEAGTNCLKTLQDELLSAVKGVPEIVHFSGHSVQADDGSVYLILPGNRVGRVHPLPLSDFAVWARAARVQLVILSSCESSRPESVFRLAQVGIPAAVGFRWEVEEQEAAHFSVVLHTELAKKVPLARAFHWSVADVNTSYPGSPTFASPMLVVQSDEWTS